MADLWTEDPRLAALYDTERAGRWDHDLYLALAVELDAKPVVDDEWTHLLGQVHRMLVPGGHLAFETRNPAIDWPARWTPALTRATYPHPDRGEFASWVEVVEVKGAPTSYTSTHAGHTLLPGGRHLVAHETLRFRSSDAILASLNDAGLAIEHLWGDWDRTPSTPTSDELIFVAVRP